MTFRASSPTIQCLEIALVLSAVLFFLAPLSGNCAQQPATTTTTERDRGIKLYEEGDTNGAIDALRAAVKLNNEDGKAWHYLGLAFKRQPNNDEARRAFEKAARIRVRELATITSIPSGRGNRVDTAERYEVALESAQEYLNLTPNAPRDWIAQLEALRFYQNHYSGSNNEEEIISGKEVTTKVRILKKPAPEFGGDRASGTSVLRAVFSADGTVKHVLVLQTVDHAFDQACIEAARKIEFTPAMKDGRKVSMILQVEYNRSFY